MGGSRSKPEEINIQQQQLPTVSGIGPTHIIATCMVIFIAALLLRVIWRTLMREIESRPRRTVGSVATIV